MRFQVRPTRGIAAAVSTCRLDLHNAMIGTFGIVITSPEIRKLHVPIPSRRDRRTDVSVLA